MLVCLQISLSAQTVSNVTAEQVGKTIHIYYDLDKAADVALFLSTDGGATYKQLKIVSGDVGAGVKGGHKTIVWDVLEEQGNFKGDDVVFKVRAFGICSATLSDYDGNSYQTVQIGEQCWMAENLRTTHYPDGIPISKGNSASKTAALWYYVNDDVDDVDLWGLLYNWNAVVYGSFINGVRTSTSRDICPTGWRMPTVEDWAVLIEYVGGLSECVCGNSMDNVAKALSSTKGWVNSGNGCAVGNKQSDNGITGFSAQPSGIYSYERGDCTLFGISAFFWSSTQIGENNAYGISLSYEVPSVSINNVNKANGFSVRCLKD